MKRIIFLIAAVIIMVPVQSYSQDKKEKKSRSEIRSERKALMEAEVEKCIADGNIKIIISRIFPTESSSLQKVPVNINRNTSDGYYLELKEDIFSCYLPYIGTSRSAPIGGQNLSLEAKSQKVDITKEYEQKSDSYIYRFSYKNDNMNDIWKCTIQLFKNGDSNIRMDGVSRDPISYRGELQIPEEDNKN